MLMWSHYADSHKGFVLEYDPLKFFTYNNCKNCTEFEKCEYIHLIDIFPVLYENERYDITEYAVEALHRQCFYSESENVPFTVGDTLFTMKVLMQKNPVWAYEKEWRLRYLCKKNRDSGNFVSIPPAAIYLGSEMADINKKILRGLAAEKGIDVFEMAVTDGKNFELAVTRTE